MKELHHEDRLTTLIHMKLAQALRKCLGSEVKLLIKVIRQMLNGALQVTYVFAGTTRKCSTFVSLKKFNDAIREGTAAFARGAVVYAENYINRHYFKDIGSVFLAEIDKTRNSYQTVNFPQLRITMPHNSMEILIVTANSNTHKWEITNPKGQPRGLRAGYDELTEVMRLVYHYAVPSNLTPFDI